MYVLLMEKPDELRAYGSAEVSTAAEVSRGTFDAWLLRKHLPLPPGPGKGGLRQFTLFEAILVGVVAELVRLGLTIGAASHAAGFLSRLRSEGHPIPTDEAGWKLLVTPTLWADGPPSGGAMPMPLGFIKSASLEQLHSFIDERFSSPMAFVLLDFSRIADRVRAKLKAD